VTSQGSPYARFKRALATGDLDVIRLAAAELPRVRLDDALRICILLATDPERYERAAARWLGRFCLEAKTATLDDVDVALTALQELPELPENANVLGRLCRVHNLR
jgi:hypothetical protein